MKEEDLTSAPAARLFGYFSRKGAKDAKGRGEVGWPVQ